jgi:hypothetical protein
LMNSDMAYAPLVGGIPSDVTPEHADISPRMPPAHGDADGLSV